MELKADLSQLDTAVDYVRDTLSRKKVDSREAIRAALITEEAFRVMTECAESPDEVISISIVSRLGNTQIRISGRTKEFAEDRIDISSQWSFDDLTPEQEDVCRSLNRRILGDRLSVRFRRGISVIKIGVSNPQFAQLYLTFAGLLLGVLAGKETQVSALTQKESGFAAILEAEDFDEATAMTAAMELASARYDRIGAED